ncbi:TonB-dependent receptor [Marivirga arenosa]|uniref:TonB-dependent receptor n=1 Tax=Marivirga arenosa TaxID=3059076 RepID=A0AA51X3R2_9BACT|nr:TonB-dependent receptor plug domain-containing protein [Marivirga sp. BKB1-2]WNB17212.1 TonB-dependent receptor [Marivirga sp. BKB1-2]
MRTIFLSIVLLSFISNQLKSQNLLTDRVTIDQSYDSISFNQLANLIERKSSFKLKYKEAWIENKFLSINQGEYTIEELMDNCLSQLELRYLLYEPNFIVLLKSPPQNFTYQQEKTGNKNTSPLVLGQVELGLDSAKLTGYINSAEDSKPISGALITSNTGIQEVTSSNGYYELKLPVGYNRVSFKALGISDLDVELVLNSSSKLDINLFRDFLQLEEVSVSATRPDENISDNTAGSERMTLEEIEKIPPFLGEADVIKSLSSLPGVGNSGETSAGFNVRGSSGSENLILIDNGILYNGGHLFGLYGSVNSDAISSVELFKGIMPAEYGGRTSSILKMELRDGRNAENLNGYGGVGIIASRLSINTPIIKDKSSLSSSIRAAYPNIITSFLEARDLNTSSSAFGDFNLSYKHNISDKSFIKASAYKSLDRFNLRDEVILNYDNNLLSLNYGNNITNNLFLDFHYSYSRYNYSFGENDINESYNLDAYVQNHKFLTSIETTIFDIHDIKAGVEAIEYNVNSGAIKEVVGNAENTFSYPNQEAYSVSTFITDRFSPVKKIDVLIGLRSSYYSKEVSENQVGLDPRFSINYKINRKNSVKFGYNRSRQFIHLLSNTASITPFDLWRLSNDNINPSVANQISLGYFKNFNSNNIETSVEGFYKESDNFLDFRNGANLLGTDNIDEEVIQGEARAYGIEFYAKRKVGKLTGWLSYTWLRSFERILGENSSETINNGEFFPTFYDQPHNVNSLINIVFSRRFDMSLNFVYSSGRPITFPNSFYEFNGAIVANYPERNNSRIPDYHRLDISFNLGTTLRKYKMIEANWSLIIYNVYGRRNPYSVFFRTNQSMSTIDAFRLSVIGVPIPALSYNFKF